MRNCKIVGIGAVVAVALCAVSVGAQQPPPVKAAPPPAPAPTRAPARPKPLSAAMQTRSDINLYIELHNFLMTRAPSDEGGEDPAYLTEVNAYKQAREMSKEPKVWQFVTDACIEGPDIDGIKKKGENLPAGLVGADREAAKLALQALATAWPRFEAKDMVAYRRSLQQLVIMNFHNTWEYRTAPVLLPKLYDTLELKPIDAPITVYPVVNAYEQGTSGHLPKLGYYLVLPAARRSGLVVVENLLHELTHIIDEHQPAGTKTVLRRLREKGAGSDPAALDALMHGLVIYNAGELVRRYTNAKYEPLSDVAPSMREQLKPYMASYQGPWNAYLDGKILADEAIAGLVSALKPTAPATTAK